MARKLNNRSRFNHEFTQQIHSTQRTGTQFANMDNHNEKKAKENKSVCCYDCRYFNFTCSYYIGMYHKTCEEFEWW